MIYIIIWGMGWIIIPFLYNMALMMGFITNLREWCDQEGRDFTIWPLLVFMWPITLVIILIFNIMRGN